jgi:hypothetical protein
MAQIGFTPIQIYFSTTSSNLPLAANLTNGELAINSADGKLFYKDSGGTVQTLASQNLFASQTANYVYASPNGSAGVATFRALVSADIPSLTSIYIPYTGAVSAVDLNAKTLVNVANLGVNTTSVPTIKIRAIGDNNSSSRIAMRGYSSDANSSAIRVTKFRGTVAAPQAPQSGDSLGKFELAGYGTTSADGYPQVSLEGVTTEVWGATARGAKAVIKVTPNTTITQVTAVTIDQDSKATFAGALSVTGHTTFEGVTSTGATGTGKLVYDTSPTLITPVLGVATATSINKMAITAPATSSTLAVADGKTLTANKTLTLDGTDSTTMTFPTTTATIARTDAAQTFTGIQTFANAITPSQTTGITGTTTNNNASAGYVGEYVSSTIASGSSIALTTGTFTNITSISLTAGDWDVSGTVALTSATGIPVFIYANGGVTTTSVSGGGIEGGWSLSYTTAQAIAYYIDFTQTTPILRLSLSATTTVYLTTRGSFTGGTVNTYGMIRARRIR